MPKPDLNKLKAEIDTRKKEKGFNSVIPAKDEFLNGLLNSLHSGKSSSATEIIKLVENKTAERFGEKTIYTIPTNGQNQIAQQRTQLAKINENETADRDELLWAEIERMKKQTLAESMQSYISPNANTGVQHNHKGNLNEGHLVGNVEKIVNNYLVENFGPVVEEAIKSTILEMYAVERIKEVLTENKEMIQEIVYDTIRQIQAKNKAKTKS